MEFRNQRFNRDKPTYQKILEQNRDMVLYSDGYDSALDVDRRNQVVKFDSEIGSLGYVDDGSVFLCNAFRLEAVENGAFPAAYIKPAKEDNYKDPHNWYSEDQN